MRVLPILFNSDMVRAILAGRKTVTRRVVRGEAQKVASDYVRRYSEDLDTSELIVHWWVDTPLEHYVPYRPGDILYVRETWRVGAWDIPHQMIAFDYSDGTCGQLVYIASREMFMRLVDQSREDARKAKCVYNGVDFVWEKGNSPCRWHPSIHMPREAARIFLRVTDVRVERLQEMRAEDSLREGVKLHLEGCLNGEAPLKPFADLWDSTIKPADRGRYGWDANPWVWVVEFKRIPHDLPCNKEVSE